MVVTPSTGARHVTAIAVATVRPYMRCMLTRHYSNHGDMRRLLPTPPPHTRPAVKMAATGFGLRSFFGVGKSLARLPNHVPQEQVGASRAMSFARGVAAASEPGPPRSARIRESSQLVAVAISPLFAGR